MTVREILTTVDRLRPNAFTDQEKLQFLNTIEGRIYREILEKAEPPRRKRPKPMKLQEETTEEIPETEEAPETENVQEEKPAPEGGGFLSLQKERCFRPFREGEEERELAVGIPYTDIYIYYLAAMIDFYSGDSGRYNDSMAMFNRAWEDYAAHYRATHKPKQTNLTGMLPHRRGNDRRDWF